MAEPQILRTTCDPNCHANPRCGISAHVEDGRITRIGPATYPVAEYDNRICLMGMSRLEYQYSEDRLRYPLKRSGNRGEGEWERISWDEALDLFASRLRKITEQYGSRAVAFSSYTGSYGILTRGSAIRFASLIGATAPKMGGIDYGVPKGLEYMFGVPARTFFARGGHEFADTLNSRTIIIWGGNPAATRLVDYPFVKQAQRGGAEVICIDPNRTATAASADRWISLRPGTDVALALGLLREIIEAGLQDEHHLSAYTNAPFLVNTETRTLLRGADLSVGQADDYMVWDRRLNDCVPVSAHARAALKGRFTVTRHDGKTIQVATVYQLLLETLQDYPLDKVAEITRVPGKIIQQLAVQIATNKPTTIRIGYGVDRWYYSDIAARSIAMLSVFTGNIGVPGGGLGAMSGSPATPVNGGKFYLAKGKIPSFLNVMETNEAVINGSPYPIKMQCISQGNPFNQTLPNRNEIHEKYIPALDFIVVIDHFMTDTAMQADLVLPACTIFEKTDLVPGIVMQLQQKIVEPLGEAKSDFEIYKALAEKMGFGEHFDKSEQEYIDDMLEGVDTPVGKINFERLRREQAIYPYGERTPYVGFQDYRFDTPSGRIEIYKEELREHGFQLPAYHEPIEASPENELYKRYPLNLIFSHSEYRIHSTFANLSMIKKREPEPVADISPDDAASRNIQDGSVIRVFNDRGSVKIKCRYNEDVRPGVMVISEGYWCRDFIEGDPYGLTHDKYSPTSENYAFYDTLVQAENC